MATFDDATVGTSTGGTTPDFRASKKSQPAVRASSLVTAMSKELVWPKPKP
jgi:hypothetical protein